MNKINVILVDDFEIMSNGIEAILSEASDIEVVEKTRTIPALLTKLKTIQAHVALISIYHPNDNDIELITSIHNERPKLDILILSSENKETFIYKTIKAGAKGFLTKESDRNELVEAIYSLRNGYDYYSKSISDIVLKDYFKKIKSNKSLSKTNNNELSQRELEVLKLLGDGFTNNEVADKLFISVRTVESHKNHIMQKANLRTTVDLIKYGIKNNIIKV